MPKIVKTERGFIDIGGKSHDVTKYVYSNGEIYYSKSYAWDNAEMPRNVNLKMFNAPKELRRPGISRIL
jgi:hypothetical protein